VIKVNDYCLECIQKANVERRLINCYKCQKDKEGIKY
jgi:hypothetical protein